MAEVIYAIKRTPFQAQFVMSKLEQAGMQRVAICFGFMSTTGLWFRLLLQLMPITWNSSPSFLISKAISKAASSAYQDTWASMEGDPQMKVTIFDFYAILTKLSENIIRFHFGTQKLSSNIVVTYKPVVGMILASH
jgi:hypothetical protein